MLIFSTINMFLVILVFKSSIFFFITRVSYTNYIKNYLYEIFYNIGIYQILAYKNSFIKHLKKV